MPTTIRFRRDGVVMHMHPVRGSAHPEGRWHQPWERHPSDPTAHAREDTEHPYVLSGRYPVEWDRRQFYLTPAQEETYFRALRGGRPAEYSRPGRRVRTPRGFTYTPPAEVTFAPILTVDARRFGVEMECITNVNEFTAAAARRGIRVQARGYSHQTPDPGTWMLTPDGSLSYTGRREGFRTIEVVSPILQGEAGIRALKLICEAHAEVGTIVNRTCGLHVHHDATTLTAAQAKRVAHSYHNVQRLIDSLVAPSRRGGNTYCNAFNSSELRQIDAATNMSDFSYGIGRYKHVNIGHAYMAHKTIEFRQHQGSVDFEKIAAWISLGQHIMAHAVNGQTLQSTDSLDEMCNALGMPEDTLNFFKARKLKLEQGGL